MLPDGVRHRVAALSVALIAAGALSVSAPRSSEAAPMVALGMPVVEPDMSAASVPIVSAAVDLTASDAGGPLAIRDGALRIPLDLGHDAPQAVPASIAASGRALGELEVRYYPAAHYRALGQTHPGVVLLATTLPRAGTPQWAPGTPTDLPPENSLRVDVRRWDAARADAGLAAASADAEAQVRALFELMSTENSADEVCDEVASGIDVFEEVVDGACSVACHGYARIVRDVLRSSGTPARVVSLGAAKTMLPSGVVVQASEGHQTTEVWDGMRWVWVDGTLGVLRAFRADGAVLSAAEVVTALADPATRGDVSFVRLDAAGGEWVTRGYDDQDAGFKASVASLFTADKVLSIPDDGRG